MNVSSDKDYYSVLGVAPGADPVVLKAAYRALAKKYHPDQTASATEQEFNEIRNAYEVLSDEEKSKEYEYQHQQKLLWQYGHAARLRDLTIAVRLDDRWEKLTQEFPELGKNYVRLERASEALAERFKLQVLGAKHLSSFYHIATRLEYQYYKKHFSKCRDLQALGRKLLAAGLRDAAHQLEQEINACGRLSKAIRRSLIVKYEALLPAASAGRGEGLGQALVQSSKPNLFSFAHIRPKRHVRLRRDHSGVAIGFGLIAALSFLMFANSVL